MLVSSVGCQNKLKIKIIIKIIKIKRPSNSGKVAGIWKKLLESAFYRWNLHFFSLESTFIR